MNKLSLVLSKVEDLYKYNPLLLPFHNMAHINFVLRYADRFCKYLPDCNKDYLFSAVLTHDLNYFVERNSNYNKGEELRGDILLSSGYNESEIQIIEKIVSEAAISNFGKATLAESKVLADADNLFKVLPDTPVLRAHLFLEETNISVVELAEKILKSQREMIESGRFFYIPEVNEEYFEFAKVTVTLWEKLEEQHKKGLVVDKFTNIHSCSDIFK